ncbi:ATP-binding cassette subfamily C protein/ATP-binding cassette subfamily C protein CydC [Geodermatophilus normandii]|uniref:ATP-binding cassette subfamily C protein/ATP-binding cassette subfamily C protein CydC n=1 Tax=Geodermatophilus normandii TaxID=1137989 RepID=A0A317QL66_9ACTN|nr:thiol reductant ABC exporter subunit CydC [Geodermatophilus normandii]PWW24428.1 ATP-binding cassette subfamily C protein/ATP-binding cassette subfamily C protein CydC [Geodermatophilus normandii]
MREVLALARLPRTALAVVLGAVTVLCGAALLATSGALITGAAQRPSSLLVLMPLITGVRLFGISRAAVRYAERLVTHDVTLRLVARVRARVLERLVPLAPAALTGVRGGELLSRVRTDVDELQGVVVRLVAPAGVAVLAGGTAVTLTALVSPVTAAVLAVLLLALGVLVPAAAARAGRRAALAAARADADVAADTLDLVRGLADHLAGDGGATALHALDGHLDRQEAAERASARLAAVTTLLREGVPGLGVVAALWLVGSDVAAGTTSPLLLAACALGVLGAFEAVGGLGAAWAAAGGIRAAAGRVQALAAQRPAVTDPESPLPLPLGSALRFEDVTLTYPGAGHPALTGLDLDVPEGAKVALTGRSGAGKSSALALALRARDPDAGRVTLGGTDLRRLPLAGVRSRLAWSAQAPQVLGGTLAGNLRLGRGDATDDQLLAVLAGVGLGGVAATLGLDGWVGEGGERLSAGERARVALARALLSRADVLVLDEPTAHLDAELSARVLDLLARDPRAVLLVTHDGAALDRRWQVVDLDVRHPAPARG